MDAKKLFELGDNLFGKKAPLNLRWQSVAENFYPERADFTITRQLGWAQDAAGDMLSSYPFIARRSLGNQLGTMLRPTAKPWFHVARRHVNNEQNDIRVILQGFEKTQRRAMYDPDSAFTRATKEGDHDFAAFGQCAISVEIVRNPIKGPHMLYRDWHLRDMCWQENEHGKIGSKFRRWKPTAQTLVRTFERNSRAKLDPRIIEQNGKTPFEEVPVMHIVVEADMYDDDSKGRPHWSIWWDEEHQSLIEATPIWTGYYVIPRWQTVSGSQYSYSPATVAALPDARLIQAMTYTLLEAGEKATSPPLIATQDAVRSDVSVYAGGITWVDAEYDERLGDALRPLTQDFRGFPFGVQMAEASKAMIREAFFLNDLKMPQRAAEMTAYEVGQRVQEYIRAALPIFEPMEQDYNAALCEDTFELMRREFAFGNPLDWPKELRGADISFTFESPLHDAIEQQLGQIFIQGKQMLAEALAIDPSVSALPKMDVALRDVLNGIGTPATWMHTEAEVQAAKDAQAQKAQAQEMLAAMQQGGQVVRDLGQSGVLPPAGGGSSGSGVPAMAGA